MFANAQHIDYVIGKVVLGIVGITAIIGIGVVLRETGIEHSAAPENVSFADQKYPLGSCPGSGFQTQSSNTGFAIQSFGHIYAPWTDKLFPQQFKSKMAPNGNIHTQVDPTCDVVKSRCGAFGYEDNDCDGDCGRGKNGEYIEESYLCADLYLEKDIKIAGKTYAKGTRYPYTVILFGDCNDHDASYKANRAMTNLTCDGGGTWSCTRGKWTCAGANNSCPAYQVELDYNGDKRVDNADKFKLGTFINDAKKATCNTQILPGKTRNCDVNRDGTLNIDDYKQRDTAVANYVCRLQGKDTNCDGVADDNSSCDNTIIGTNSGPNTGPNSTFSLGGKITKPNGTPIEDVTVKLIGPAGLQTATTDANGMYTFASLAGGVSYQLVPGKDDNHVNGVTTADIVKIQRHILGLDLLTDPYDLIAADVNDSKTITAADISEIRKLILGTIAQFSKVPSWKFFLPNSTTISTTSVTLSKTVNNINFYGIKMGDVNDSATPSFGGGIVAGLTMGGSNEAALEAEADQLDQQIAAMQGGGTTSSSSAPAGSTFAPNGTSSSTTKTSSSTTSTNTTAPTSSWTAPATIYVPGKGYMPVAGGNATTVTVNSNTAASSSTTPTNVWSTSTSPSSSTSVSSRYNTPTPYIQPQPSSYYQTQYQYPSTTTTTTTTQQPQPTTTTPSRRSFTY